MTTKHTSETVTYASVVSRESVQITLTLEVLNDLQVKTADIKNAYLTAPVGEKIWCRLGPEYGQDAGKRATIVRELLVLRAEVRWCIVQEPTRQLQARPRMGVV